MNHQDPFVIIKNYRTRHYQQQEQQPVPPSPQKPIKTQRIALRQLDSIHANNRGTVVELKRKVSEFKEEDKENYIWFDDNEKCSMAMSSLPNPNQSKLINYSDYDISF